MWLKLAEAKGAAGFCRSQRITLSMAASVCVCVCEWKVQWNNAHMHTRSRNMTENYLEEILWVSWNGTWKLNRRFHGPKGCSAQLQSVVCAEYLCAWSPKCACVSRILVLIVYATCCIWPLSSSLSFVSFLSLRVTL